jgi:hypothetical protein
MTLGLGPVGATLPTAITTTTASGTSIQATLTAGGATFACISEPLPAFTLSGTVTMNVWGKESATGTDATVQLQLAYYPSGGPVGSVVCTATGSTKFTTTYAAKNATCTATSQTIHAGDRLVALFFVTNVGTMAAGTVTLEYDGGTSGSAGNSYVQVTQSESPTAEGGTGGTGACSYVRDNLEPTTGGFPAAGNEIINLPALAGANNAIIVGAMGSAGDVLSVTDDRSDSYYVGAHQADTTNTQDVWLFYAIGVNANAHQITIAHTTSDSYTNAVAMVCTNVATSAALDVSTGANANSATIAAGSVAPNYSGDIFVQLFWNEYTLSSITGVTAGSQSYINWALMAANDKYNYGMQWGDYNSTSAMNPTMSETGQTGFATVAIGLRASAAGTAFPSGIQVTSEKSIWFPSGSTLPRTEQAPCPVGSNAMAVEWLGAATGVLSGITDSNGNTWTSTGAAVCTTNAGGCSHAFYAQNATMSSSQALTFAGTVDDDSAIVYCLGGAKTSGMFDKTTTAIGAQSTAGNLTVGSITPTTSNGLILSVMSVSANTQAGVTSPSGAVWDACLWSQQSVNSSGCDENNAWSHFLNPGTSAYSFTFSPWSAFSTTAAGDWVWRADAFEAASTSTKRKVLVID